MEKAKVYFIKTITPQNVVRLYEKLGKQLPGKVAVKVHSGEEGNQNYLKPEFMKDMVEYINGTVVECNTAYGERFGGERDLTEKHLKVIEKHGWNMYNFDLMDAEGPDDELEIENGKILKKDIVGSDTTKSVISTEDFFLVELFYHPRIISSVFPPGLNIGITSSSLSTEQLIKNGPFALNPSSRAFFKDSSESASVPSAPKALASAIKSVFRSRSVAE